ncbi:hypothetical protein [Simkania negevensis]|uniref:Secreted protein n=1 Tax=Simkania negevensis (strain ATCC VR-1471 / DSM 27360 / Z) TaxID=331113 RepID=F8L2Y5_SIMNZ|nr:hypothetical protein [Simkania negevensis]CCB87831.1 unknown protein [Simkania negevensis Z]
MKNILIKFLILTCLGITSFAHSEIKNNSETPYQGCFQEIVPILHASVVKDLKSFELHMKRLEGDELRESSIDAVIDTVKANPQKYSQDFGSTKRFVAEVYEDQYFWRKVHQKMTEIQKKENE